MIRASTMSSAARWPPNARSKCSARRPNSASSTATAAVSCCSSRCASAFRLSAKASMVEWRARSPDASQKRSSLMAYRPGVVA
uniref:Uncharacterized protein n=1 Tax=Human herpesvirus 2 TaxID=10310 RepID=A0A481TYN8_HHV2|nr:hypothetical protein [Human alphaherpesvirus 2]QBH79292.1 hypothetical protein [Human alphaherpesvirus 2]QBH79909.1 hypothetical protein [Human alphaherpesvirus 2]QBH85305.1 hypothetical protein [Human alphaherpesvirus 2]QBH85777.1 hypothetical protein [Human alphaherpesvirus 2]